MNEKVYLKEWKIEEGEKVVDLIYQDGDMIRVSKVDFDRAFGVFVSGDKATIRKEYGLVTKTIRRNREALGLAVDDLMVGMTCVGNGLLTLNVLAREGRNSDVILADGLLVGYEV